MDPQPALDKFPFSRQAEAALLTQNGALEGLEESVPEEDISCRDRPLKAIDVDETVFKNGLSLRRPAINGLKVAKYYQPHDPPCRLDVVPPVDSEMKSLCGKDVKPVFPQCGAAPGSRGVLGSLADLANTHQHDVGENQVYEVYSKGTALILMALPVECSKLFARKVQEASKFILI